MKTLASVVLVCALLALPVAAQAPAKKGLSFSAKKQTLRANGIRLDGNARVVSPGELDAAADVIAIDASTDGLQQVRASGNVRLKIDVPSRDGGAPVHIESTSRAATLDPKTRVLTLSGNVRGFYQPKDGGRATLAGEKVMLRFSGKTISADIDGGGAPVVFELPVPETGALAGIGTVSISSTRASLDDKAGRFEGNARAVSTGARAFAVSATSFVVARGAGGELETLQTSGRTTVKADLPQSTTPAAPNTASVGSLGTPVRLEVSSDSAVVRRADNTLSFQGNVKGWYELLQADKTRARYPFAGDRVLITLVPEANGKPADFAIDVSGQPSTIEAPQLNLGL